MKNGSPRAALPPPKETAARFLAAAAKTLINSGQGGFSGIRGAFQELSAALELPPMPETEFTPETLRQLNREAAGLLRLEIIRPQDIFGLSCAIFAGDGSAFARLTAVHQSGDRIRRQARKKPIVCLCCPRSIRNPRAVLALLFPASDAASMAVASALCDRCSAVDNATLMARAAAAYQQVWPGLRCIEMTHLAGGNA